jgi:serine/threonine protein phosphatase PrpC
MTTGFVQERDFTARQYHGRRENQEDYFAFADAAEQDETSLQRLLLVVGDGLGAHAGGSVASYIGVNTFVRAYHEHGGTRRARLRAALDTANETLGFITSRMPQVSSPMGTTLLAALIDQQELRWVSVGDSPLFLFRDGELRRLNADHSLAPLLEERVRAGFMTEEEAAQHPDRHALQSALLGEPMELVDDPEETLSLRSGDIIVAASDGLLTLSHKALEELLSFGRNTTADKIAEAVLFAIRRINYERQDNVTIGIVKVA